MAPAAPFAVHRQRIRLGAPSPMGELGAADSTFNRRHVRHHTSKSLSGGGFGSTNRLGLTPRALIRRPSPTERGLNKKSVGIKSRPTTSHWTLINGALERASFIGGARDKWKPTGLH